jgi:hypothetical protein
MPLAIGLIKVSGMYRCNRYSQYVGGHDYTNRGDTLLPSLPQLLRDGKAFVVRERQKLERDKRNCGR